MIYDIHTELSGRRALIHASFSECPIDANVVIRDSDGNLYDATVITRATGCVVVRVHNILLD